MMQCTNVVFELLKVGLIDGNVIPLSLYCIRILHPILMEVDER